jgi:hypothetical protein
MALPKGSESARIRTELETIIEEEELREYAIVYTNGSVMDERSGCTIAMGHRKSDWLDRFQFSMWRQLEALITRQ